MDKAAFDEMNRSVINEFRATGGKAGGVFEGKPLVLVHHTGAKSGTERIAPLVPLLDDGRIYIFASKGGADTNPDWYRNIEANPGVTVELAPRRSRPPRAFSKERNATRSTPSRSTPNRSSGSTSATPSA